MPRVDMIDDLGDEVCVKPWLVTLRFAEPHRFVLGYARNSANWRAMRCAFGS
jgi:hypothetical protein